MLAAVERVLQALRSARSDDDFARIIGEAASRFGFRSAYIFQYATQLRGTERIIDSDARRRVWWPSYFKSELRPKAQEVLKTLGGGPILRSSAGNHPVGNEATRDALAEYDLVEVTNIPISYDGVPVGIAGFSGSPTLDAQGEMALQLVAYAIFAQIRTIEVPVVRGVSLTPREREVIALSAEGLTSQQIAVKLGMSARTANQHIDNVADKLGTRNRAHTVAEVIRHGLLN